MRKLENIDVNFISIVKKPANDKSLILKGVSNVFNLKKFDNEMRRVYGIVYAPLQADLQGDYADVETIRKAADSFMKNGRQTNVDLNHSFAQTNAYVAESWLLRKNDSIFPGEAEGAWAVGIQVENQDVWEQIKKGLFTGISLAGQAQAEITERAVESQQLESISEGGNLVKSIVSQVVQELEKHLASTEQPELLRKGNRTGNSEAGIGAELEFIESIYI